MRRPVVYRVEFKCLRLAPVDTFGGRCLLWSGDRIPFTITHIGRLRVNTGRRTAVDISVVICTRNRADQLKVCLEHLAATQSSVAWELVVLDNGSVDATPEIISTFEHQNTIPMKVLTLPARGLGRARNAAWRISSGDIVAFTDDDCYVAPDFLEAIVGAFARGDRIGYVGGRILLHDPSDARITIEESTEERHFPAYSFLHTGAFHGANMAIRRSALESIAGFDESFGYGTPFPASDIETLTRVSFSGWEGLYDPRIVLRHHHMRKPADVPQLLHRYATGRGAYWAKFLLMRQTRVHAFRQWRWRVMKHYRDPTQRKTMVAEFLGAIGYMKRHGLRYLVAPPPVARVTKRAVDPVS